MCKKKKRMGILRCDNRKQRGPKTPKERHRQRGLRTQGGEERIRNRVQRWLQHWIHHYSTHTATAPATAPAMAPAAALGMALAIALGTMPGEVLGTALGTTLGTALGTALATILRAGYSTAYIPVGASCSGQRQLQGTQRLPSAASTVYRHVCTHVYGHMCIDMRLRLYAVSSLCWMRCRAGRHAARRAE